MQVERRDESLESIQLQLKAIGELRSTVKVQQVALPELDNVAVAQQDPEHPLHSSDNTVAEARQVPAPKRLHRSGTVALLQRRGTNMASLLQRSGSSLKEALSQPSSPNRTFKSVQQFVTKVAPARRSQTFSTASEPDPDAADAEPQAGHSQRQSVSETVALSSREKYIREQRALFAVTVESDEANMQRQFERILVVPSFI